MQVEARYALGKSLLLFAGGLLALVVNTLLYFFASIHYPLLWPAGAIGVLAGSRALDRRVRLRIGPEGLWYAPWGTQPIPWGEFEEFSVFNSGNYPFLEARPSYPDQVRDRMSAFSRLNSSINARFGRPSFYINPTQLDVTLDRLLEALVHHNPHAA